MSGWLGWGGAKHQRIRSRQRMPGGSPCGPLWYIRKAAASSRARSTVPKRNAVAESCMERNVLLCIELQVLRTAHNCYF